MPMKHEPKDQRVPVMMTADDVDAIDAWRRLQFDLPTRAEAIRRLIARALALK